MTPSDWVLVFLTLVGIIEFILGGLIAWLLLNTVSHAGRLTALEVSFRAEKQEINRRFDEMKEALNQIRDMLGEALQHRRKSDGM